MDYFGFAFLKLKIMNHNENKSLEDIVYFCEIDNKFKFEQWKDIVGYEGKYQVSDLGRVKSLERFYIKKNNTNKTKIKSIILKYKIEKDSGYFRTCLRGGKVNNALFSTHRLVALAFIPNPENKPQVNHKKGIKTDNRAITLEWSTAKENNDHAILNDLKSDGKGENHHLVKLSEKEVLEIREIGRSISLSKMAKIYKISKTTVSRILLRKIWKHI